MLNPRYKYLQIAFNRSLAEAELAVLNLPASDRIIIEAGTPLIKRYGLSALGRLRSAWGARTGKPAYVVADLKCMDRGSREVEAAAFAGASAATCLGLAPKETIEEFIKRCEALGIDSMLDMMNVPFPFEILGGLRKKPSVVVMHRGADDGATKDPSMLPLHQIRQIRGAYGNVLISVAGGETARDVRRNFFNDAQISVVWRDFNSGAADTAKLATELLLFIKS